MSKLMSGVVAFGLVCALAVPGLAQEQGKKKKGELQGPAAQAFQLPKEIELSEEQKGKVEALKKEMGGDLVALLKKQSDLLTADQKAARKDVAAKNKAEGKKGKEAKAAVDAALKLTEAQQKDWDAIQKDIVAYQGKIKEKLHSFLTDDQKAKLKPAKGKKKAA